MMSTRANKVALRPAPMTPGLHFVCALFEFTPGIPEELSIQVGDVVKVQKRVDDFWLKGLKLHNGESGQFPRDFVKDVIIPKYKENETLLYALDTFYPESDGDLPFDKGDIIVLERKINNEWGSGRRGSSVRGMFPLNYTERLLPLTIASLENGRQGNVAPPKSKKNVPENVPGLGVAKATMTLTAQLDEELSFCVDDEITILEVLDNGTWYKGRLGDDIGTFPASFVQLITPLKIAKSLKPQRTAPPVQLSRTGSKAWKEDNLEPVPVPILDDNLTNNNNFHTGDKIDVTTANVSDTSLLKEKQVLTDEVPTKDNSGATITSTATTTGLTTVAEHSSVKPILYTVKAMHKFTGNTDQELSFNEGIEIPIFEEADDHWLVGKVNDKEGYIPRAYVSRKGSKKEKYSKLQKSDEDCLLTRENSDKKSQKNTNFVKTTGEKLLTKHHVYSAPKTQSVEQTVNHNEPTKQGNGDGKKAVATYDYEARNKFDLTIFTGDTIWVLRDVDENWVEVRNESGKKGIVPTSYVQCTLDGDSSALTHPSGPTERSKDLESPEGDAENDNLNSEISYNDHPLPHVASCPTMPVLLENAEASGKPIRRNLDRSSISLAAFSSPKPFISQKPRTLPLDSVHQGTTRAKVLQKSISVDSARRDLSGENTHINRSNSNPQSQYVENTRDTKYKLKAWQYARRISSPTGPLTPPNERAIQAESESNTESDNSVSKKSNFTRTGRRSSSMREKRLQRRYDDMPTSSKDTNFVKIRSDSDLSLEQTKQRSSSGEKTKRLPKRSEPVSDERRENSSKITWHIDSSSTTSTGSSSSYGETRASHSTRSDMSGSEGSSAASRKSGSSGRKIQRSAPPIPAHTCEQTTTAPEQPQSTSNLPSPWSPPVPTRKQSLQHDVRKRVGDTSAVSPEMPRQPAAGVLTPSRPAPELPPPRIPGQMRPATVSNNSSPQKKVPPGRPANPPHARYRDPNARVVNGGNQERVRSIASRGMKEKIEKLRSDIEDYSRMKTDLEHLYQTTFDGRERREIAENMEFVKANLRRLQKEFHELIEGQQDHTYESIEQYMVRPTPPDGNNSFERLPAPPVPPVMDSPGSIRKKRQDKRLLVAEELVNTERDFLTDVTVTVEDIMNELIDRQIPQTTIGTLFANILQVKDFSERLLGELEEALQNESSPQTDFDGPTIGQVFIDNNPEMKEVYMPYYRNHDDAMKLLEKLQDDVEFMQAVHTCLDAIKNKVNVFDLGSFLIKPVQRFLKYPLLIEELIKLTDQSTRENPTDHDKLILAHKMMQDVAKDINEDKRIKDLVRKYKDASNEGISEKLGKISIKASKKKFSRLSTKIGRAAGITTQETKDAHFDDVEKKFKILERAAKLFVYNVTSYCDKCRDVLCAELVVAHAMVDMVVQPDRSHPVAMHQAMAEKMSGALYRQFHDQVQLQVLSPVAALISSFKSPQTIIDKRLDKLIDYERLQKHSDSKEKIEAARHDYEALNKSLLDELPKLSDLGVKLLTSCTAIFAKFHRDFERKLLDELKPLLCLILQSGKEPNIPSNMETYERFRPAYQEAIHTISRHQVVPATFGALFGSSTKGSSEPQRKSRTSQSVKQQPEQNSTLKQPIEDRDALKKKYHSNQLCVAEKSYSASQLMDVSCCEGDLVAVLKQQDPMANTQRWFVNRGGPGTSTGFLPAAILRPYDPVRDDALLNLGSPPSYPPSPQPTLTPTPAPRSKSPTPSTRSTSSAGSSSTSGGSTKPPLSPHILRETLKRGDGAQAALTEQEIMEVFVEEDEMLDDDFDYGEVTSNVGASPKSAKQHFRAEYDFTARSDLELTVHSGDIVKLIMNHDTDGNPEWWLVSNVEGKQGYVPSNYLTKAEYL